MNVHRVSRTEFNIIQCKWGRLFDEKNVINQESLSTLPTKVMLHASGSRPDLCVRTSEDAGMLFMQTRSRFMWLDL